MPPSPAWKRELGFSLLVLLVVAAVGYIGWKIAWSNAARFTIKRLDQIQDAQPSDGGPADASAGH